MSPMATILIIALLAGIFGAGAFWVSVDVFQVLGAKRAARRERKRLEAEAKALKEKEGAGADAEGGDA